MLARRREEYDYDDYDFDSYSAYEPADSQPSGKPKLKVLQKSHILLDKPLRTRCQTLFAIFTILAMLVTIRSGISASRGYALVATQQEAQLLEQENERLRIEIAKLKSPQRIKAIAESELNMQVPAVAYFSRQ